MYKIFQLALSVIVLVLALIAILWIFELIPQEEVISLAYRLGGAIVVVTLAAGLIALISGKR